MNIKYESTSTEVNIPDYNTNSQASAHTQQSTIMPLGATRQSTPSISVLGVINSVLGTISPSYDKQHLKLIEHLVQYNHDFSTALWNVVNLGNTPIDIIFDEKVNDKQAKLMRASLLTSSKTWYENSSGMNSLRNDLFAQIIKYGAIAVEKVPFKNLKGIEDIVLVPFTTIEFRYDKKNKRFYPVQTIGTQEIVLNPKTFTYTTVIRNGDTPYPIPPFLAALDSMVIEGDMMSNMTSVVKKFGLLGFIEMLLKEPSSMVAGSPVPLDDAQIRDKANKMVQDALNQLEVGMNKGSIVGFNGHHELKFHSPATGSASGVSDINRINVENKINGLKQNPFMHGRNFSTTESLGKVILEIFILQIKNYQTIIDDFLSGVVLMDLQLKGFKVNSVIVKSKEPSISDESLKFDTEKKNIDNSILLRDQGIITQTDVAHRLGLEAPALDAPIQQDITEVETSETEEVEEENLSLKLQPTIAKEFIYEQEHECGDACGCAVSFNEDYPNQPLLNKNNIGYYKDANGVYGKTVDKFLTKFTTYLTEDVKVGTTATQISNRMLALLQNEWAATYTPAQEKVIKNWTRAAYTDFRNDKTTVFGAGVKKLKTGKKIPSAVFQQVDFASLDFFKDTDEFYLGKFINDKSTKKKITQFLKDEYLEGGFTVGDKNSIDTFKGKFEGVLKGESWKIKQIVRTSVNNMRNMGSLSYMNQAEVEKFEVQGVNDQLQCPYCAGMQGKQFSFAPTFDRMQEWIKSKPENIDENSPFLTGSFDAKGLNSEQITEKVKSMSSEQLQNAGVETPPYHPSCRDLVVAVI